ncbi:MAG: zinc-ribbon domain-containing protein [Chloroflexi bacterium]|nr:MAG: zinc-ribbon domain-containing protein [Chloroflexota bacterium]
MERRPGPSDCRIRSEGRRGDSPETPRTALRWPAATRACRGLGGSAVGCNARMTETMAKCPNCGEENAERAKFCWNCGQALTPTAAPTGEVRKTVTVLFADIVSSTSRGEQTDPESTRRMLASYIALVGGMRWRRHWISLARLEHPMTLPPKPHGAASRPWRPQTTGGWRKRSVWSPRRWRWWSRLISLSSEPALSRLSRTWRLGQDAPTAGRRRWSGRRPSARARETW